VPTAATAGQVDARTSGEVLEAQVFDLVGAREER
jgi:hypothetical protein